MDQLKWIQQDNRNYTLEDAQGKVHLRLENRTCSESNITEALLEDCKQDFLERERKKSK